MGVNPFFSLAAVIYLGKAVTGINKKFILLAGAMMNVIGTLLLGLIYYLPSDYKWTFVSLAIICRILSGFGSSLVSITNYSLIHIIFKHQNPVLIGYLQACTAFGGVLGYLKGSMLYDVGGYTLPFYVISAEMMLVFCLYLFYIPNFEKN